MYGLHRVRVSVFQSHGVRLNFLPLNHLGGLPSNTLEESHGYFLEWWSCLCALLWGRIDNSGTLRVTVDPNPKRSSLYFCVPRLHCLTHSEFAIVTGIPVSLRSPNRVRIHLASAIGQELVLPTRYGRGQFSSAWMRQKWLSISNNHPDQCGVGHFPLLDSQSMLSHRVFTMCPPPQIPMFGCRLNVKAHLVHFAIIVYIRSWMLVTCSLSNFQQLEPYEGANKFFQSPKENWEIWLVKTVTCINRIS